MCYDKALEIDPKYSYASYKKGMLLKQLSRYEEALECFEKYPGNASEWVIDSMDLQSQALRDKLKPREAGSKKAFETYCRVLGNLLEEDDLDQSKVQYAHKKLNENILQHTHKLPDYVDPNNEEENYEMGEWLIDTGKEKKEVFEYYDECIKKFLKKGDLLQAVDVIYKKVEYYENLADLRYAESHQSKSEAEDVFNCYEEMTRLWLKSPSEPDDGTAYYLTSALSKLAFRMKDADQSDNAIEYIDHAIKLEREHWFEDSYPDFWRTKVEWLTDEEAIKFLDDEIKAWRNSRYHDDETNGHYIDAMNDKKNELLKDLKSNT
jgi:tetratricopeptide (TPR) repeat protein